MATLLTPNQVAQQLNINVRKPHAMRREGYDPAWVRLNRKTVRYTSDDVVTWTKHQVDQP